MKFHSSRKKKIAPDYHIKEGSLVWCNSPSNTTTRGNSYRVRGVFAYKNGDNWDYFITIKNDYGYTIKVNADGYRLRHPSIPSQEMNEIRLKEIEKKLRALESEKSNIVNNIS